LSYRVLPASSLVGVVALAALGAVNPEEAGTRSKTIEDDLKIIVLLLFLIIHNLRERIFL
jgi:hypothetical protein